MSNAELHQFSIDRLRAAFDSRRCVTAWLGYGEVLFLGFGDAVLPEFDESQHRTEPPYELETHFADWSIQSGGQERSRDSERAQCESAASSLVGQEVAGWELFDRLGLKIRFGGSLLTIRPSRESDSVPSEDAWCLRAPDCRILAVSNDDRFSVVDADFPINHWFG
jgi:hypothetical protein